MATRYDVILEEVGRDPMSVAFALLSTVQRQLPYAPLEVRDMLRWLRYTPLLVRRGLAQGEANRARHRFTDLGAKISLRASELLFPLEEVPITAFANESYSHRLVALREPALWDWADVHNLSEAYRFTYLPAFEQAITIRLWYDGHHPQASAKRSLGHIGWIPGPPGQETRWLLPHHQWDKLLDAIRTYRFWESATWNTVPQGHIVLDGASWVFEGWREGRYHVLTDDTPNEGQAFEVGVLCFKMLPRTFKLEHHTQAPHD